MIAHDLFSNCPLQSPASRHLLSHVLLSACHETSIEDASGKDPVPRLRLTGRLVAKHGHVYDE
jgi:hypothetical protein